MRMSVRTHSRCRLTLFDSPGLIGTVTSNSGKSEMSENVESQAKFVASLADTMRDSMWATDIIARCATMRQAIDEIERIARSRAAGER